MKNNSKLDQLTALRFLAALMIVIHHSAGLFGMKRTGVAWGQGVSFFFVLSGFILTYVYPRLETLPEVKAFWRARVARVWPAYLASFALGFWLIPYAWDTKTAVAHLLMVQSWLPLSSYYFSYNAVSWSVSTEVFFYVAFPILLYKWSQNWPVKLFLSGAVLVALLYISNYLRLPNYGNPGIGSDGLLITQHGLIYISPISRIFEFLFGMAIALLWRKKYWANDSAWATPCELGAILLCVASVTYANAIARWWRGTGLAESAVLWLAHSGSLLAFGLLIYVMAQGRGRISRILSTPFLVLLGEISFSVYLIHQILLNVYSRNVSTYSHIPNPIAFLAFILVLLLSSYLMWIFIEMPGRRLLLGHRSIHGTSTMKASWRDHVPTSRSPVVAGLLLLCLVGMIQFSARDPLPTWWNAEALPESARHAEVTNVVFDGIYKLHALVVGRTNADVTIDAWWEELRHEPANEQRFLFLHVVDGSGEILLIGQIALFPYQPPDPERRLRRDRVTFNVAAVQDKMAALGFGVFQPSGGYLVAASARSDWGGKRILVAIDGAAGASAGTSGTARP